MASIPTKTSKLKDSISAAVWNKIKDSGDDVLSIALDVVEKNGEKELSKLIARSNMMYNSIQPQVTKDNLKVVENVVRETAFNYNNEDSTSSEFVRRYVMSQIQTGGDLGLSDKIAVRAIADTYRDWGLEDPNERQHYIKERITLYAHQATSNPEEQKALITQANEQLKDASKYDTALSLYDGSLKGGNILSGIGDLGRSIGNIGSSFAEAGRAIRGSAPARKPIRNVYSVEASKVARQLSQVLHPVIWEEISMIGNAGMLAAGTIYNRDGAATIAKLLGTRNKLVDDALDAAEDDGEDLSNPRVQKDVISNVRRRVNDSEKDLAKRIFLLRGALSELAAEFGA